MEIAEGGLETDATLEVEDAEISADTNVMQVRSNKVYIVLFCAGGRLKGEKNLSL